MDETRRTIHPWHTPFTRRLHMYGLTRPGPIRATLARTRTFLKEQQAQYRGKRCFILGNGPSLANMDLTLLRNELTIGSNYIFLHAARMGFHPTFLCVVNYLVAEQRADVLNQLTASTKLFPAFLRYCLDETPHTYFLHATTQRAFSEDITEWVSWRSTVTYFALQVAYYLGADPVYLIGVDHQYVQPQGHAEGHILQQRAPDPNHFSPNYFAPGFQWQQADTAAMQEMYQLAQIAFERDQRRIYNATAGGALELFPRVEYTSLFGNTAAQ